MFDRRSVWYVRALLLERESSCHLSTLCVSVFLSRKLLFCFLKIMPSIAILEVTKTTSLLVSNHNNNCTAGGTIIYANGTDVVQPQPQQQQEEQQRTNPHGNIVSALTIIEMVPSIDGIAGGRRRTTRHEKETTRPNACPTPHHNDATTSGPI